MQTSPFDWFGRGFFIAIVSSLAVAIPVIVLGVLVLTALQLLDISVVFPEWAPYATVGVVSTLMALQGSYWGRKYKLTSLKDAWFASCGMFVVPLIAYFGGEERVGVSYMIALAVCTAALALGLVFATLTRTDTPNH